jgi:hypothetical protein
MKQFIAISVFLLASNTGFGQAGHKRIKIVLLGTFHFHQSLDSNSRLHSHLFTKQRQKQVADIVNDLVSFAPDKIFIERETSGQAYTDSVYAEFKKGNEPKDVKVLANEIVQMGFRTARKLNLPAPVCVDYRPEGYSNQNYTTMYPIEQQLVAIWRQFDANEDNARSNARFLDKRYPTKRPDLDSLLRKSTLKEFLLSMNQPDSYVRDTYSNWNWFYSKGGQSDYTGMDWLANFWYGRNVKIYGNILREVDYEHDQRYLLIIGASHLSFLKHLFAENPYFEVIEVDNVLKH